jgi:hypothetical protein
LRKGGRKIESSRPVQAKLARPYPQNKIKTNNKAYVVECFHSKCEVLSSSPSTKKIKDKENFNYKKALFLSLPFF